MKFLVTGANGFVGKALCVDLRGRGRAVRAAMRQAEPIGDDIEIVTVTNIDASTDWQGALHGIEIVIHLAARVHVMRDKSTYPLSEFRRVNTAGTERLARCAAAAGVKRIVYVSTIKVNGEATHDGQKFTADALPAPQDPYGISKWEAEQALHRVASETGMEVVIVRPPLVYGSGVKGNFAQMLSVVARGIPLPLASVQNCRNLIYIGNLTDALITCATHPAAAGKTYLVGDSVAISTPDLLRQLAYAMRVSSRLYPCPVTLLRLVGKMLGLSRQLDRLLGSFQVDNDKMRADLDWTPPYTTAQGLQITAQWYQSQ